MVYGLEGDDTIWGGALERINDNRTATGAVGGGGNDRVIFDISYSNSYIFEANQNLYITTAADMSDNVMDSGVIIEGFGKNLAAYHIEALYFSDGILNL